MEGWKIAIFLYCYALIHFLSDFLNHWMEKNGKLKAILLHSFLYTLFFIPLFWRLNIDFYWLILVFSTHFLIDSQWNLLFRTISEFLQHENETQLNLRIYTAIVDQILHLCVPIIIVFFLVLP